MPSNNFESFVKGYANFIIRHCYGVIAVALLAVLALTTGARTLSFDDDWRAYFSEDNPKRVAFEVIERTYTSNDNILFVISPENGDAFSRDTLTAISQLTGQAWQLPYAQRVDSLTNFQHMYADGDDLTVEELFAGLENLSDTEIAERKATALGEPRLVSRIISADGKTTAVMVTFQLPESEPDATEVAVAAARKSAHSLVAEFPDIDVRLTGELMLDTAFREAAEHDIKNLTPIMYAGIIGMLLVLLRSVWATAAVIVIVTLSLGSALGFAGWLGISLTTASVAAPTMIMTLAVADSVHLISSVMVLMGEGHPKREAINKALQLNFSPIAITSVTTAVGFLALNLVDVPPFQDFGTITAFGVMIAFILSITLLPGMLAIVPMVSRPKATLFSQQLMSTLADFVIARRNKLIVVITLISIGLLAVVPLNQANNQFVQFFGKEIEFRGATDHTMQNLTGIYRVEYSLSAGESNGVTAPAYLVKLERFSSWLREQPEVVHVSTLSDTMKKLNKNLHSGNEAEYQLPANRGLGAQYLLLYEMSLPYGLDLNDEINVDKSATRVQITLGDVTTKEIEAFVARSDGWLENNASNMFSYGVGASVMFADIFKRSTQTMLYGAIFGLVIISILLVFALRSVKHGLISLLPNLLPAGLAFGIWALIIGQVNMGVALVITMTLGIVVDDTVHFLSKYLNARRRQQLNTEDSIRYAFSSCGYALMATTVCLVIGFLIMSLSSFSLNADSSLLTAIAIAIALVVDFLLLPPLLMIIDGNNRETMN